MDKFIEKLVGILTSLGLAQETIDEVVAQLSAPTTEEVVEEKPVEGDPTEQPAEEGDPQDVPPTEEGKEGVGELPPSEEPAPVEVPTEESGQPLPPQELPPAPAPAPFDPTELIGQITELQNQLGEVKKANEGLVARCGALEEALKKAGVIEEGSTATEVGDPLPAAAPQSPTDDVLADVLSELNRKR